MCREKGTKVHLQRFIQGVQQPDPRVTRAFNSVLVYRSRSNLGSSRQHGSKTLLHKRIHMRLGVVGVAAKDVSSNSRQADSLHIEEGVHAMCLHVVEAICGKGQQRVVGLITLEFDVLCISLSPIDFHLGDWIFTPPTVGGQRSNEGGVTPVR